MKGRRSLGLRERAVLLLADGQKTRSQMRELLQDDGSLIDRLVRDGYLETAPARAGSDLAAARAAIAPIAARAAPVPEPAAPAGAADAFDGKRSLATTRMFLFDLVERMFTRRAPAQAALFRDRLREARDRHTMLAVAREMIEEIEQLAGAERADGISARIAMLMPSELSASLPQT